MTRRTSGSPLTGTAALARTDVRGRRRVPSPAARISARKPSESKCAPRSAASCDAGSSRRCRRPCRTLEAEARRGAAGTGRGTSRGCSRPACGRAPPPSFSMPCSPALDLDEHADRRFVDRDDDVFVRELLAVLLVPEPDVQPELLENLQQDLAVADERLDLFAQLHGRRLHRALERQPALAVLDAHPQHAAPAPQLLVVGVEERVLLEPAAEQWRAPAARTALRASSTESNLSLTSRSSEVVDILSAPLFGRRPRMRFGLRVLCADPRIISIRAATRPARSTVATATYMTKHSTANGGNPA